MTERRRRDSRDSRRGSGSGGGAPAGPRPQKKISWPKDNAVVVSDTNDGLRKISAKVVVTEGDRPLGNEQVNFFLNDTEMGSGRTRPSDGMVRWESVGLNPTENGIVNLRAQIHGTTKSVALQIDLRPEENGRTETELPTGLRFNLSYVRTTGRMNQVLVDVFDKDDNPVCSATVRLNFGSALEPIIGTTNKSGTAVFEIPVEGYSLRGRASVDGSSQDQAFTLYSGYWVRLLPEDAPLPLDTGPLGIFWHIFRGGNDNVAISAETTSTEPPRAPTAPVSTGTGPSAWGSDPCSPTDNTVSAQQQEKKEKKTILHGALFSTLLWGFFTYFTVLPWTVIAFLWLATAWHFSSSPEKWGLTARPLQKINNVAIAWAFVTLFVGFQAVVGLFNTPPPLRNAISATAKMAEQEKEKTEQRADQYLEASKMKDRLKTFVSTGKTVPQSGLTNRWDAFARYDLDDLLSWAWPDDGPQEAKEQKTEGLAQNENVFTSIWNFVFQPSWTSVGLRWIAFGICLVILLVLTVVASWDNIQIALARAGAVLEERRQRKNRPTGEGGENNDGIVDNFAEHGVILVLWEVGRAFLESLWSARKGKFAAKVARR